MDRQCSSKSMSVLMIKHHLPRLLFHERKDDAGEINSKKTNICYIPQLPFTGLAQPSMTCNTRFISST